MSGQSEYQRRRVAAGLCGACGTRPLGAYTHRCDECQAEWTRTRRKRTGFKPWRPGGPGRPPKNPTP